MVEDIKKALAAADHAAKHGWASVLSDQATRTLKLAGKEDISKSLEKTHAHLVNQRVDYIEYGDPVKLTPKQRAKLNCRLLNQVLVHRAERLMIATGQMFDSKNLYGLALPGYEASSWWGVGAPKGTPAEIIEKLNKEINAALADPKMKGRLAELGGTALPGSPADFGKLIADETEKWGKVIRAAGIKAE
jgi:Tripartite tricarboxylate transporter family receptor